MLIRSGLKRQQITTRPVEARADILRIDPMPTDLRRRQPSRTTVGVNAVLLCQFISLMVVAALTLHMHVLSQY